MTLLSFISLLASPALQRITSRHLGFLLLVTFGVYVHRDIRPLATFSLEPVDGGEGWLLWSKIIILAVIAVVVPLVKPKQYASSDPEVLYLFQTQAVSDVIHMIPGAVPLKPRRNSLNSFTFDIRFFGPPYSAGKPCSPPGHRTTAPFGISQPRSELSQEELSNAGPLLRRRKAAHVLGTPEGAS